MAHIYLQETISWKGERYDPGAVVVPDELARALGLLLPEDPQPGEAPAAEGSAPVDEPKETPPVASALFEASAELPNSVLVKGQLNLDAKDLKADHIAKLPSIGMAIAADLLSARPVNGFNTFETFEAVARQLGFGNRVKFAQVKPLVTFES